MRVSYNWLQDYFDKKLPEPKKLAELLTIHSYEVEDVEEVNGDYVLNIDILPNRAHDSLSHRGVAKELSVLLNIPLKNDPFKISGHLMSRYSSELKTEDYISLSIEDERLCRRAMKRVAVDVEVKESPDWLKKRLEVLGQKSINNIVDATNYVVLDIGQPVHAFDFDKLAGIDKKQISIRKAKKGERITTLDGQEYTLDDSMLVISDSEKALDIAGVKGGENSGIDENTKKVVLSVCNFNPVNIRKTSRKLKLRTDASQRFENEISPELTEIALERLSELIKNIAGGEIAEDVIDVYPKKRNPYKVGVSVEEINKLLGTDISEKEVEDIFTRLGFEYKKVKPIDEILELAPTFEGIPYKYGASISHDAPESFDCSSFTGYLFAQAGISIPRMSVDQYFYGEEVEKDNLKPGDIVFSVGKTKNIHHKSVEFMQGMEIKDGVSHCGIYIGDESVIHASGKENMEKIVKEKLSESTDFKDIVGYRRMTENDERFVVTVPFERLDLRIKEDLIEEIGRIYGYENIKSKLPEKSEKTPKVNKKFYYENKIKNFLANEGFSEVYTYSFRDSGDVEIEKPFASDKNFLRKDLFYGLNDAEQRNIKNIPLLDEDRISIFEIGNVFTKSKEYTSLGISHSGGSREVEEIVNKLYRFLGVKKVVDNDDIHQNIFEMNLDELIKKLEGQPSSYGQFEKSEKDIKYKPISPYPFALRDIAVFVPEDIKDTDVLVIIKKEAGELLVNAKLFDVFGKDNKKSYAFRLVFQSHEKTLSDDEVNSIMNTITKILNGNAGWQVR